MLYLDPVFCPDDHPFAMNKGQTCCRHYKKKNDVGADPVCDGGRHEFSDPAVCCRDAIPCPDTAKGCKDGPYFHGKDCTSMAEEKNHIEKSMHAIALGSFS